MAPIFPIEILLLIVEEIASQFALANEYTEERVERAEDLDALSQTCKGLLTTFQMHLFNHIIIWNHDMCSGLHDVLKTSPDLAQYVRKLSIKGRDGCDTLQYPDCGNLFTMLQKIEFLYVGIFDCKNRELWKSDTGYQFQKILISWLNSSESDTLQELSLQHIDYLSKVFLKLMVHIPIVTLEDIGFSISDPLEKELKKMVVTPRESRLHNLHFRQIHFGRRCYAKVSELAKIADSLHPSNCKLEELYISFPYIKIAEAHGNTLSRLTIDEMDGFDPGKYNTFDLPRLEEIIFDDIDHYEDDKLKKAMEFLSKIRSRNGIERISIDVHDLDDPRFSNRVTDEVFAEYWKPLEDMLLGRDFSNLKMVTLDVTPSSTQDVEKRIRSKFLPRLEQKGMLRVAKTKKIVFG